MLHMDNAASAASILLQPSAQKCTLHRTVTGNMPLNVCAMAKMASLLAIVQADIMRFSQELAPRTIEGCFPTDGHG